MGVKINSNHQQFLDARKEVLSRISLSSIQSRGKYKQFDVFTWLDAPEEALISTLSSMPSPIHWVVSAELLVALDQKGIIEFPNVHKMYVVGKMTKMPMVGEFEEVSSVQDIISNGAFSNSKGTLLMSVTGNMGIDFINELTYYLKAIQGK